MVPAAGTAEALDGLAVAVAAAERGLPEDRSPRDALPRERRWLACSRVVQDEAQRWIGTQGREGVAPSLLAQLYPALLAHGQRKERGVYFTGAQLAEATARRVLDPLLQASPRTLRITDPAAGGGAFLLAALGRLQHALERRPAELLGMLHGTDLDPTAALLANLALWQAAGDRSIDPWSVRCVQAGDGLAPGHERTFDVVLGNPPWETWQPSRDELRRELGDEAAARRKWHEASAHRASTATGLRARFSHQGSGKLFTYRLFLERSLQLLREGGRLGLVLPAGLWFDREAAPLRKLLLDDCRWEWLFGFENRARIFPIDTRYRFGVVVAERGAVTTTLRAAFQQPWKDGKDIVKTTTPSRIAQADLTKPAQHQVVLHTHAAKQFALFRHQGQAQHHTLFNTQTVQRLTFECDLALAGQKAHEAVEQGGFASAVGSDHRDHAALVRVQAQAMQDFSLAIAGVKVLDTEQRLGHVNVPFPDRRRELPDFAEWLGACPG